MAIPLMEEDVEVISKLGDVPGSDDGLSTTQLKNRFDLAGIRIKRFLNEVLVPHMNQLVDVQALLNGIIDKTLTQADKAADAATVGAELEKMLMKSGGAMTGVLNMNGLPITNLRSPVNKSDAVHRQYVDDKHKNFECVAVSGGWTGNGPYTQTIAVQNILSTDKPHWGVVLSDNRATAIAENEAFAKIDKLETFNGSVLLTCLEEKPDVNVLIQMEVNR